MRVIISIGMLMLSSSAMAADNPTPTDCAPGIYVVAETGELTALPQTKADHRKLAGLGGAMLLGPLGGNRMKVKTVLSGASATTKVQRTRPAFRFCFAAPPATTGSTSDYVGVSAAGTSPHDYQLVRFEPSNDQRELVLAALGSFGGPVGQISKSSIPFQTQEVAPGQFNVTTAGDLEPGQYGFLSSVSAPVSTRKKDAQEKVYDFEVTG